MVSNNCAGKLIVETNVRAFFQAQIAKAVNNQGVKASDDTVNYVVNLLMAFINAKALYEQTPDGPMIKPLALIYADAVDAPSNEIRNRALKRLGDVALFISGIFPNSLNRKLVDIDYYIAMGGNAYGFLSEVDTFRWQAYSDIFSELANKFTAFVDVLGEISDKSHLGNDTDIMRLYEIWVRTGSKRTARRLRNLGIQPMIGSVSRRHH